MQLAAVEAWECGDCGSAVTGEALFAYCDGCARTLCVSCLEDAQMCDGCDVLSCRHCVIRLFAVECPGCQAPLHVACVERRGGKATHPLCTRCGDHAATLWS